MKEKVLSALKWFYKSFIWLFVIFLAIDITTKQIIIHSGVEPYTNVADWVIVRINYVLNYNAAFGIGANDHNVSRIVYLSVASLVSVGLIIYMISQRKKMKLYVRACLMLILVGAFGNMIDRIFYGPYYAVVDWIDFFWFWDYNFNIADSCIVVAAFMLIIYIIVLEVKEAKAKRDAEIVANKPQESATNEVESLDNNKSE